jgi:hypothetical protein
MIKNAFTTIDQVLYNKGKNRDLMRDLKSELSGHFEDVVMACFMEPGEYDARQILKACAGMGFNSDLLIEIVCTRTNEQLRRAKSAWSTCLRQSSSLEDRVRSETKKLMSGNHFQKLMLAILEAQRPMCTTPDAALVQSDAATLNRFVSQAKKSDAKSKFVEVFTKRSFAHIAAIASTFQSISRKYTLVLAVKKAFGDGSDTSRALRVITEFCQQPYDFWAIKLRSAMKGLGTKDDQLVRIVVSRCECDMYNVGQVFAQRYGSGKTLGNWIDDDTSHSYNRILKLLCGFE